MQTKVTSGLSILIHGVISHPDVVTSCDKLIYLVSHRKLSLFLAAKQFFYIGNAASNIVLKKTHIYKSVNIPKFQTLVVCKKGLDKQCKTQIRSSLIRVFPVCYSGKHFVNSRPENHYFI